MDRDHYGCRHAGIQHKPVHLGCPGQAVLGYHQVFYNFIINCGGCFLWGLVRLDIFLSR
jgi:hypothetical protein